MTNIQEIVNQIIEGRRFTSSSNDTQKEKKGLDNQDDKRNARKEHPKMPSGFQCFVCGKQYATNEERIQHLEEDAHGSMYDTASPQEREDTRRLQ
jgi:hypothetical protein